MVERPSLFRCDGMNKEKLFFVGNNKTGTTTIHRTFQKYGISSIHNANWISRSWDCDEEYFQRAEAFSDGIRVANLPWLDQTYDAFFILNTRNVRDWVVSEWNHRRRRRNRDPNVYFGPEKERLIQRIKYRNVHHREVLRYFSDRDNFMILNVADSPNDIVAEHLSKVSGIGIDALVFGQPHKKPASEYVKEPAEAMEALRELGIGPSDYDKVVLDIEGPSWLRQTSWRLDL